MTDNQREICIFGYGSLIWGTGAVRTAERLEGIMPGWRREWTWISRSRHGAPTCSVERGGQVKGVFLRLNPETANQDLDAFRLRENRETEETIADIPSQGAITYFWTMGNNLEKFPELEGLCGSQLARALAERAKLITMVGQDGVLPSGYMRKVHEFDPNDAWTSEIVHCL
jgi:hypothetical protein